MWTRVELKDKAKAFLRKNYWYCFVASLVIMFAGGSHNGINTGNQYSSSDSEGWLIFGAPSSYFQFDNQQWNHFLEDEFSALVGGIALIGLLFVFAFRIFLGFPLELGGRKYFSEAADLGVSDLNRLGFCFKDGRYFPIIKAMLRRGIFLFLLTLLLIIPGLIMGYSWRMVPYILTDNPHIGSKRALQLSRSMTMGHKWDIFVLDLSFLGWYLLGLLALIIGVLFVKPYDDATNGHLYQHLKEQAISKGLCAAEELDLTNHGSINV